MALHSTLTGSSLHVGPTIRKNNSDVGARRAINVIEGSNITLTVTDDPANDEVEVTIAAASTSGLTQPQVEAIAAFRI